MTFKKRAVTSAAVLCCGLGIIGDATAAPKQNAAPARDRINWADFMSRQDPVWTEIPREWHEGPFVGNGLHGTMIWAEKDEPLHWDVGRSDVTDRSYRLPIGKFVLRPQGTVTGGTFRLDLWNAEARGTLRTDRGQISTRTFTHATLPVTIVEREGTQAEQGAVLEFVQTPPLPARETFRNEPVPPDRINPAASGGESDTVRWCRQPFKAGGGYTVAWSEKPGTDGKKLLAFTVDFAKDGDAPNPDKAVGIVRSALRDGTDALAKSHRAWWHAYWPQSFVSIPDTRMENFYWMQMYKMAAATRADKPALDLMGPWFRSTPWPRIWWNLNIQLTYWPVYTANRLELGESLTRMIDTNRQNLINNVPEEWRGDSAAVGRTSSYDAVGKVGDERGNLLWTLHNYWLQYRYSGDEKMLRNGLYPILTRSVGYYLHLLEPGDDGRLHLPLSTSPEYPDKAPDTNYDLSLLRWGLTTLIATSDRLRLNDPLVPLWKETLAKLTPYPVDAETGYMVGRGVPFVKSHRHFSHLMMVYPLHMVDPGSPQDRPLIEKSLGHWMGLGNAHRGYSFTGASAMSSWLNRPEDSVRYLNTFLDRYVKPSTMYTEAGPVIETPLSAAASLQEMLLQSWSTDPFGTDIRVFPAIPAAWKDVTFHNLRAEGAFLVSASRRDGKTQFVRIQSLAGAPCRVRTDLVSPIARGSRSYTLKTETDTNGNPFLTIDLRKGETVLLTPGSSGTSASALEIAPVAPQPERINYYGLKTKTATAPQGTAASE